jgi:hypothetical protein
LLKGVLYEVYFIYIFSGCSGTRYHLSEYYTSLNKEASKYCIEKIDDNTTKKDINKCYFSYKYKILKFDSNRLDGSAYALEHSWLKDGFYKEKIVIDYIDNRKVYSLKEKKEIIDKMLQEDCDEYKLTKEECEKYKNG